MTIASTTVKNTYTGAGTTNTFNFTYYIFAASDLSVSVVNTSTGAITALVLSTDYTVANSGVINPSGGSITLVSAGQAWLSAGNLAIGYTLTILRNRPATQLTNVRDQSSFYPEVIEDEFDQLAMVDQQLLEAIGRCIQIPTNDTSGLTMTLPVTSKRINTLVGFDTNGNVIAVPTGGPFSGLANGQLLFGDSNGHIAQSSSLFWDNTHSRLGILTSSPLVPLHIGAGSSSTTDVQVQITRTAALNSDSHGFSDMSVLTGTGAFGYGTFDAFLTYSGAGPWDHFKGFQNRSIWASTGTLTNWVGLDCAPQINAAGTITNIKGLWVRNVTISGGGAVTNQYGMYVDTLTGPTNNWGFYINANDCFIGGGGKLGINTSTPRRLLDALSTTGPQVRLTYTDSSVYCDFKVDASGNVTLTPTGPIFTWTAAGTVTIACTSSSGQALYQLNGNTLGQIQNTVGDFYLTNSDASSGMILRTNNTAAFKIDVNQILIPQIALATGMTKGFINIPGAAGPPSGTPATTTGFPLYWDSTNLQLYAYTGGAWKKSAAFT